MSMHRRLPLLFTLAIPLLFLASTMARAELMSVSVGFDGVARTKVWTPISVRLSNTTGRNIDGVINVIQGDLSDESLPMCLAKVDLPANSNKLYHVYARLREFGSVTVNLRSGLRLIASKKVNVSPASQDEMVIVSVGDRTSRLNFLAGDKLPTPVFKLAQMKAQSAAMAGMPGGMMPGAPGGAKPESNIQIGSILPTDLPDRPAAYDGVDMVIVRDLSESSVDPKALKALSMWVAAGGTLVVSAGPNYQAYQTPFYDELLPVKVKGVANVPSMAALSGLSDKPFPSGAVAVAASTPTPSSNFTVKSDSGTPLYAQCWYGSGRVVFLAFDYLSEPFTKWDGQAGFWKQVMSGVTAGSILQPSAGIYANDQQNYYSQFGPGSTQSLAGTVEENPAIRTPGFNTIAVMLLLYLILLVPVNFFVLKQKRRLEAAWITTPAIVIAFVILEYGVGYTMKGGHLQLNEATVIETSSGARYARAITATSVFSPARRSYDMEVADPYAVTQVMKLSEREAPPQTFVAEKSSVEGLRMAMWSSKTFEAESGTDLGGMVVVDCAYDGNRLKGSISNTTRTDLEQCEIVVGSKKATIGGLKHGSSQPVDLEFQPFAVMPVGYSTGAPQANLDERVLQFLESKVASAGGGALIGRPSGSSAAFGFTGDRARSRSATFAVFHVGFRSGSTFSIAPDTIQCRVATISNGSSGAYMPGMMGGQRPGSLNVMLYGSGSCTGVFTLPIPKGGKLTSLMASTALAPYGGGGPKTVQSETRVLNVKSRQWDVVSANPAKSIPNPMSYVNPACEIQVQTRVTGAPGSRASVQMSVLADGKRE